MDDAIYVHNDPMYKTRVVPSAKRDTTCQMAYLYGLECLHTILKASRVCDTLLRERRCCEARTIAILDDAVKKKIHV
jgi:hypothetical protein